VDNRAARADSKYITCRVPPDSVKGFGSRADHGRPAAPVVMSNRARCPADRVNIAPGTPPNTLKINPGLGAARHRGPAAAVIVDDLRHGTYHEDIT